MAKKIVFAFGTRPEAIKMCPIIKEFKEKTDYEIKVVSTGQHKEMLKQVLDSFYIEADLDFKVMEKNQGLDMITIKIISQMTSFLDEYKPDLVMVHGDTTTSFAAGLASFYKNVKIAHVEAGLRTYNNFEPFPEEFNRTAISAMASLHFAPTEKSKDNLIREGKREEDVYVTGNTVIDALKTTVREDYKSETIAWAKDKKLILITAHRRENLGKPMENIFSAIRKIALERDDLKFVYPVHLNPRVQELAKKYFKDLDQVKLVEPLDVIDFHNIMARSFLILTDSGGVQEEAPSLGVPVLVLRNVTERPEGIDAGTLKLIGTESQSVYMNIKKLLENKEEYEKMQGAVNPYGDGRASERIVRIVEKIWETQE